MAIPRRHRLAMQPLAVADPGFDGVAEGMAEIEQGALAGFRSSAATIPALLRQERFDGFAQGAASRASRASRFASSQSRTGGRGSVRT